MLFLGSFPPRECGIATFTKDVVDSYDDEFGTRSAVVAIDEPGGETAPLLRPSRRPADAGRARVVRRDRRLHQRLCLRRALDPARVRPLRRRARRVDRRPDRAASRKPVVTSLHTVLPEPSPDHLRVARALCAKPRARWSSSPRPAATSWSSATASTRARSASSTTACPTCRSSRPRRPSACWASQGRTTIATFGLISRGKGLEYAIEAMNAVVTEHPEALYLILGQTHPVVRRHEGESYRRQLEAEIVRNGLADNVQLVDKYLDFDELLAYLTATDIYLTPVPQPDPDRQRHAGLRGRPGQGDRLDAVPLRAGAAGARARLPDPVPRRRRDRDDARRAARRSGPARGHPPPRLPLRPPHDLAARCRGLRPRSSPSCSPSSRRERARYLRVARRVSRAAARPPGRADRRRRRVPARDLRRAQPLLRLLHRRHRPGPDRGLRRRGAPGQRRDGGPADPHLPGLPAGRPAGRRLVPRLHGLRPPLAGRRRRRPTRSVARSGAWGTPRPTRRALSWRALAGRLRARALPAVARLELPALARLRRAGPGPGAGGRAGRRLRGARGDRQVGRADLPGLPSRARARAGSGARTG